MSKFVPVVVLDQQIGDWKFTIFEYVASGQVVQIVTLSNVYDAKQKFCTSVTFSTAQSTEEGDSYTDDSSEEAGE